MGSNLDTVKGVYEAFSRGDVPAVLGVMDEKIAWREPVGLSPVFTDQTGPEAVAENVFGQVMSMIEDFSVNPEEFIDGGDIVIMLGHYRGKGAKNGTPLDARMAHVWRFAGGKATGFEVITDTHLWREALGM